MIAWRLWMTIFGLVLFIGNPYVYSETVDPVLPEEIISPAVEPVIPPERNYHAGDVVTYQIRVRWPKFQENVRLNSPEITTENLEFLGVSQESVTEENIPGEVIQVLSFKFTAKKPGPAKIDRFLLRWNLAQGAATTSVTIPAVELKISRSAATLFKTPIVLIPSGILFLSVMAFWFSTRKKKQETPPVPSVNFLEEAALKEIKKVKLDSENAAKTHDFLSRLNAIFYRYLDQKLGWNPAKESYNDTQKTIEEKWSKKDAAELKELIDQFEYIRFSGGIKDPLAAEKLCNATSSFIERRKIS